MKLTTKQLRQLIKEEIEALEEAAKTETDLKNYVDSLGGDEWLKGLWNKYGMWELNDMFNIGYPDSLQQQWYTYDQATQDTYTKAIWNSLLKIKPPLPCMIMSARESGDTLKISYGAVIPKFGKPAQLLNFRTGARSAEEGSGLMMGMGDTISGFPGGSITIQKASEGSDGGKCLDAFIVGSTYQTTKGWGPMLYDVAMEVATVLGGGLTSSRGMVSSMAKPVWDYYLKRRPGVEKQQLDINKANSQKYGIKQLTPKIYVDDCDQEASVRWSQGEDYGAWEKFDVKTMYSKLRNMSPEEKENIPWTKESTSKVYKKDPDVIKFLGDNGLFHCPELGYDVIKFHSKDLPPPPTIPAPTKADFERAANWGGGRQSFDEGKIRVKIK